MTRKWQLVLDKKKKKKFCEEITDFFLECTLCALAKNLEAAVQLSYPYLCKLSIPPYFPGIWKEKAVMPSW